MSHPVPPMDAIIDFNGLPACRLALADGSTAVIALQGAQLLSWNPGGKGERIYLSPEARYAPGQPLRGGVPVVFPQFADLGPLPRHGFARTSPWQLDEVRQDPKAGYAAAIFSLRDDEASRALWPHAFELELAVGISSGRLDLELEIRNPGDSPFSCTAALHSYLRVKEVEESPLTGLYNAPYTDRRNGRQQRDNAPELMVDDALDRLYPRLGRPLLLSEPQRSLAIHNEGFPDLVLWNPWEHQCAALADMPAQGFRHMLCIEAAAVGEPLVLPAGGEWWGRQTLVCV